MQSTTDDLTRGCGRAPPTTGGYAEYTLLPAELAAHKPADVSFTDAATLPIAAATAYDGINAVSTRSTTWSVPTRSKRWPACCTTGRN